MTAVYIVESKNIFHYYFKKVYINITRMAMDRASNLYQDLGSASMSKLTFLNPKLMILKTDIKARKDVDEEKYNSVIAKLLSLLLTTLKKPN